MHQRAARDVYGLPGDVLRPVGSEEGDNLGDVVGTRHAAHWVELCSATDLLTKYDFTVSGSTIAMLAGEVPHAVSAKGTLDIAENGSFQVESDCSVRFGWILPDRDGRDAEPSLMAMRGFLVDGGKEILAFQTDPGAMVAARFTSNGK